MIARPLGSSEYELSHGDESVGHPANESNSTLRTATMMSGEPPDRIVYDLGWR